MTEQLLQELADYVRCVEKLDSKCITDKHLKEFVSEQMTSLCNDVAAKAKRFQRSHFLAMEYLKRGGATLLSNHYKSGEPCSHPGCLSHITHPCEGCGRIGGQI